MKKKDKGKNATNPFVKKPKDIQIPANNKSYHLAKSVTLIKKYTAKSMKIVKVFSNILLATDQLTTGVNNQNKTVTQLAPEVG